MCADASKHDWCKAPTDEQKCDWNAKDCTLEICTKNPTLKNCGTAAGDGCHDKTGKAWCATPTADDKCKWLGGTNCTAEICYKNPHFSDCTKSFCGEAANKSKPWCATPTDEEKCNWSKGSKCVDAKDKCKWLKDGTGCTVEICYKNPGLKNCGTAVGDLCHTDASTKAWCAKPTDTDKCNWSGGSNCTAEICVKNPTFTDCTKDFCGKAANKSKAWCKDLASTSAAQKCEWNANDCTYDLCQKNKTGKFSTHCSAAWCDKDENKKTPSCDKKTSKLNELKNAVSGSTGIIIGCCVGGVVLIAVGGYCYHKHKKAKEGFDDDFSAVHDESA